MILLGIDPGSTTGWCVYETASRKVLASGQFANCCIDPDAWHWIPRADKIVVERPKGYGPTRPEVVDCAYVCGFIVSAIVGDEGFEDSVAELTRVEVKSALRDATHGEVSVKNDAGVWAAVLLLHGGEQAAKKGGALHGVRAHERAALAVCVAFALREAAKVTT